MTILRMGARLLWCCTASPKILSYAELVTYTQSSKSAYQDASIFHLPRSISPSTSTLLLLVLDAFHVLIWHPTHVHHPIEDIVTVVPLHHYLLASTRRLRDTAACRNCPICQPFPELSFLYGPSSRPTEPYYNRCPSEPKGKLLTLLAKLLGHLLQIHPVRLQPRHCRNIFPLVPLDALYVYHRFLLRFSLSSLRGCGFCFFLLRVFFSAFLGVDGECGEGGYYCFCFPVSVKMTGLVTRKWLREEVVGCTFRVKLFMHFRMILLKPFFTLLCCAAELAILGWRISL